MNEPLSQIRICVNQRKSNNIRRPDGNYGMNDERCEKKEITNISLWKIISCYIKISLLLSGINEQNSKRVKLTKMTGLTTASYHVAQSTHACMVKYGQQFDVSDITKYIIYNMAGITSKDLFTHTAMW